MALPETMVSLAALAFASVSQATDGAEFDQTALEAAGYPAAGTMLQHDGEFDPNTCTYSSQLYTVRGDEEGNTDIVAARRFMTGVDEACLNAQSDREMAMYRMQNVDPMILAAVLTSEAQNPELGMETTEMAQDAMAGVFGELAQQVAMDAVAQSGLDIQASDAAPMVVGDRLQAEVTDRYVRTGRDGHTTSVTTYRLSLGGH